MSFVKYILFKISHILFFQEIEFKKIKLWQLERKLTKVVNDDPKMDYYQEPEEISKTQKYIDTNNHRR